jgi:hypothetical protein
MADAAAQAALNELAQTTQGVPFIQFLLSPWFIVILVFGIIFLPLGIVGIFSLYFRIRNWGRVRGGWIEIWKRMSNFHWLTFWSRPTGRKLKVKGEEGIELEIPFNIEVDEKDKDGKLIFGEDGKLAKKIPMMGLIKHTDIAPDEKKKPSEYPTLGGKI